MDYISKIQTIINQVDDINETMNNIQKVLDDYNSQIYDENKIFLEKMIRNTHLLKDIVNENVNENVKEDIKIMMSRVTILVVWIEETYHNNLSNKTRNILVQKPCLCKYSVEMVDFIVTCIEKYFESLEIKFKWTL